MRYPRHSVLHLALPGLLAGTMLVVSGCAPAAAQTPPQTTVRSITVVGQSTVSVKPDLAVANLGLETFAATVAEAVQENNTRMAAVMARLKELSIADKDVQSSGFSISSYEKGMPMDVRMSGGEAGSQYRVSNTVQVKVRQPEQLGAVLDAVIAAGANQVYGVDFTVEDPNALQGQARGQAVEDARRRAEDLADLAGVNVGEVLTISEGNVSGPMYPAAYAMGKGAADASGTPLSPGEVQISYQVQVTYAIQRVVQ